ncbi:MAG: amidohydrolase [Chitinophagaceae bacterium]|nr:amidohydrolase [Chitinophagaceae bacterium]
MRIPVVVFFLITAANAPGQQEAIRQKIASAADKIEPKVVEWRRDIHEHPELGNYEFRTSELIAKHLKSLGMEVRTQVATTGVVGVLKGGKPGPVVALRADMDALPVTERSDLPFASKVKATYNGQEVGLMHACGHDAHVAVLMGVAEIFSSIRKDIPGTIKFIFQPAEEGVPVGQVGGAQQMIKEGALQNPDAEVIFGLHTDPKIEAGKITYRSGATMAAVNNMRIVIKGKGSHGANPWFSVDPVVVSAQVINNLQTVVSRNLNVTKNPGVLTIGTINGGSRWNIIPEEVVMLGTIRAFSDEDKQLIIDRMKQIVTKTAEAAGATAEIQVPYSTDYPSAYNEPALMAKMLPTLEKVFGKENVIAAPPETGAEDFAFYQKEIPGLFLFFGTMPKGKDPNTAAARHTPEFFLEESGMKTGVLTLTNLTLDYMFSKKQSK